MTLVQDAVTTTQQVVLRDVTWSTYQAMLRDMGDHRSTRLAYDQGVLEITVPSDYHELAKHLLERIITELTLAYDLPVRGAGSVTLTREDLRQSAEPDACYYIQNADKIVGRRIDLATTPPPDLVLEVDVSNPSGHKLAIYAAMGVAEVWLCVKQQVTFYRLQGGEYVLQEVSPTFPALPSSLVTEWLALGEDQDDNSVIRALGVWLEAQGR